MSPTWLPCVRPSYMLMRHCVAARVWHCGGVTTLVNLDKLAAEISLASPHVQRRPRRARNPAQHGQCDPPVRQHRCAAASDRTAGVSARRRPHAPRRPRLSRVRDDARACRLGGLSTGCAARSGTHVRAHHAGLHAVCQHGLPAGRLVRVWIGNARIVGRTPRVVSRVAAHPPADAARQPQSESVEHRGGGGIRSVAASKAAHERRPSIRINAPIRISRRAAADDPRRVRAQAPRTGLRTR